MPVIFNLLYRYTVITCSLANLLSSCDFLQFTQPFSCLSSLAGSDYPVVASLLAFSWLSCLSLSCKFVEASTNWWWGGIGVASGKWQQRRRSPMMRAHDRKCPPTNYTTNVGKNMIDHSCWSNTFFIFNQAEYQVG